MNSYDLKIYDRISELLTLLLDPEFEASIENISRATGSTLAQTRTDLKDLAASGIAIWPQETVEKLDAYQTAFDEVVFELETELPDDDLYGNSCMLLLNPLEKTLFENGSLKGFEIKDSPLAIPPEVLERKAVIEEAIEAGLCIEFRYPSMTGNRTESVKAAPRMILHNTTDDLFYCITFDEQGAILAFRLDRMRFSVKILEGVPLPPIPRDDPRFLRLQYVWGSDIANEEEPVHVRIRISPDTPNILRKIRADVSGRAHAKLYEEGRFWIYEDDIIGESSFRSWLMLFGSSVKVLEPRRMADQILLSSKQRLNNYLENRFCDYT